MAKLITLRAEVSTTCSEPKVSPPYTLRPCQRTDIADLGRLYFEAFDPGVAVANVAEATADNAPARSLYRSLGFVRWDRRHKERSRKPSQVGS